MTTKTTIINCNMLPNLFFYHYELSDLNKNQLIHSYTFPLLLTFWPLLVTSKCKISVRFLTITAIFLTTLRFGDQTSR